MKNTAILLLLLLFTCCLKPTGLLSAATIDSIPVGAIPFEYKDHHTKPVIYIPGTLNNDIPVRCYFETGWSPMSFSDSLASSFELKPNTKNYKNVLKPMHVRIGSCEKTYGKTNSAIYLKRDFFKYKGNDVVMTPWTFFDKKIIEISHSKHYFRELPDTKNLLGYDVVKIKVNGLLIIPVTVMLRGKIIKEDVAIDTGTGSDVLFFSDMISKYDIKKDSTLLMGDGNYGQGAQFQFFQNHADTIKTGKSSLVENHRVEFALSKVGTSSYSFSGLIGLGFLKNFDLVFDFKTYNLYLKPIDKHGEVKYSLFMNL